MILEENSLCMVIERPSELFLWVFHFWMDCTERLGERLSDICIHAKKLQPEDV